MCLEFVSLLSHIKWVLEKIGYGNQGNNAISARGFAKKELTAVVTQKHMFFFIFLGTCHGGPVRRGR
jgi:hypothetical protein